MAALCSRLFLSFFAVAAFVAVAALAACNPAEAQKSMTTLDFPGGGKILYGPVVNQTSLPGAMGETLRNIHSRFGDRPQVGKFFQTRGTDSVATFFTLSAKKEGGKQIAGLAIVSMAQAGKPAAAVLYDDAHQFGKTANPMMKKLDEVWHPGGERASGSPAAAGHAAARLHTVAFPDNSGSVGLPEGWHITAAHQGVLFAEGPNHESVNFGVFIPVMDPSNAQTNQMIQMETQGGRVPLPGSYVAYPYGGDPVRALLAVSAQLHQKQHKPVPTMHILSSKNLGENAGGRNVLITANVDQHDGVGELRTTILMSIYPPQTPGNWSMMLYQTTVPISVAEQEQPTLEAIGSSYKLNNGVIQDEAQANINQIKQIGRDAKTRTDASNAAFDEHNRSWERSQDSQDRRSQEFSNYMLDKTVVQDSYRNERGTVWNDAADSLVKNEPERFQYVQTKDFIKGIDY